MIAAIALASVALAAGAPPPPFDQVGLALATHYHLDHWDPGAIARFLGSNPRAVFAAPPEAGAMMPFSVRERVKPLSGSAPRVEAGGARVDAIPLVHGTAPGVAPPPHSGYRIACGPKVVAHLGDASPSAANFDRLLAAGPVDVALVPYWWLLDDGGRAFVLERWRPTHLVAFHLPVGDAAAEAKVRAAAPAAWICTRPGESRAF